MKWLFPLVMLSLAGCEARPDFDLYRAAIKERLRDPSSAEFKDEKVRTLWSKDGSRYKIYCALVNSNNAFGGKSGFKPTTVVIYAFNKKSKKPDSYDIVRIVFIPGKVFIDDEVGPSFYLNCQRPDTERENGSLFMTWPTMGRGWDGTFQEEVDQQVPILSSEIVPEER